MKEQPSEESFAEGFYINLDKYCNRNGFSINSINIFSSFVPKERLRPDLFRPYSQNGLNQNVLVDDVEFEALQEKFSTYELSNDFTLDLKPVLAQVRKTEFYTEIGEPVYIMHYNPTTTSFTKEQAYRDQKRSHHLVHHPAKLQPVQYHLLLPLLVLHQVHPYL